MALSQAWWTGNKFNLPPWGPVLSPNDLAAQEEANRVRQGQAALASQAQAMAGVPSADQSIGSPSPGSMGPGFAQGGAQGAGGGPGVSYSSTAAAADQGGWQSNLLGGATMGLLGGPTPGRGAGSMIGGAIGGGLGLLTGAPGMGAFGNAIGSTFGQRAANDAQAAGLQGLYAGPAAEPGGGWGSVGAGLSTDLPSGLGAPNPNVDTTGGWYGDIFGGGTPSVTSNDGGYDAGGAPGYGDSGYGYGYGDGYGNSGEVMYAKGGKIGPAGIVPGNPPGPDNVVIGAQTGEGVLTKAAMKRYPGLLDAANTGKLAKGWRGLLGSGK